MKPFEIFIAVASIIAILLGARYSQQKQDPINKQIAQDVYRICQESRMSIDGKLEDKCVRAQEEGHAEYLCDERNDSPNNHCWVEVR